MKAMPHASRFVLAVLTVIGVACGGNDDAPAPVATSSSGGSTATASPSSVAVADPVFTKGCPESEAVDLTADDPYTLVIQDFTFAPDCFIVRVSASIAIENRDDVGHTFKINGTLVNAPLVPHQTYRHGPSTGFLEPGTAYRFHCTIHPQITGTMIVV
jgi:plastocyanin